MVVACVGLLALLALQGHAGEPHTWDDRHDGLPEPSPFVPEQRATPSEPPVRAALPLLRVG